MNVSAAGVTTTSISRENAAACLQQPEQPQTPENVQQYRRTTSSRSANSNNKRFGVTSIDSDHVADVFTHGPQTEYEEYKQQQQESVYKRHTLEQSTNRGHKLPNMFVQGDAAFGVSSSESESAKNLIYPTGSLVIDDTQHQQQYIKSHGSFQPGQQKRRGYAWNSAGIKPSSHVFGLREDKKQRNDSVAICVGGKSNGTTPTSRITSKKVEDMKAIKDQLGRARNLAHGDRTLPPDHRFGIRGKFGGAEDTAQECIQGNYSVEEQLPDNDLGRSSTTGWRNTTNETRAFGAPTVRSDIPIPSRRSISDNQNYGDDVSAQYLLYPPQFANLGVSDADFASLRSMDEVRDIFRSVGYELSDEQVELVCKRASEGNETDSISIEQFRAALNDLIDDGLVVDESLK